MADEEYRKLYCFLGGDTLTRVEVHAQKHISDLREIIYERAGYRMKYKIESSSDERMQLWRLIEPLLIPPSATIGERVCSREKLAEYAVQLHPMDLVSQWFSRDILDDHLYLIADVTLGVDVGYNLYMEKLRM